MRYALMTEPQQGLTYDEILAVTRTAEEAGIEAFFRSDHYASFPGASGLPTTDAWTTLAGLARETTTIRLGVLVSPVTFRIPGSLAKVIQTVDEMSDGRVEAGFGAGWNDEEHAQLGIPFPPITERYDMLEEQMALIHGLWTEADGWSFDGEHWRVRGAKRHGDIARGTRRHPHVIFGGKGGPRLAALVAKYGDEFNLNSAKPDDAGPAYSRIREACRAVGRDPDEIVYSAMTGVLVAETEHDLRARVHDLMAMLGRTDGSADDWLAERRGRWVMGTPDQAHERILALEAAGTQRVMLQDFVPRDLDHVRLIGRLFAP
ncbi:MAG TPA: TIGR03560 family F420-dependent LLM class oxidoreductase [Candidatus Limnocylindria bacterium]|jgi:F420-dependent oxidoreductase-like protein|nr:TIGR03560 family F420-dependent LLM class oxidoreductase [Candidatus Limnocylindria bacterium]